MQSDKQSHADGVTEYDQNAYGEHDLKEFRVDATIPSKYRGTATDQRDMVVLGKAQVLRVRVHMTVVVDDLAELTYCSATSSL